MNKNTLFLASGGLLVLALIAFFLVVGGNEDSTDEQRFPTGTARAAVADDPSAITRRSAPVVTRDELLERYGDSSVAQAEQLVGKLSELMQVAIPLEETNLDGATASQRLNRELAHPVLASIDFSAEQRIKLTDLLNDHQRRRVEALRDTAERLRSSPEPMLAFILAGDALHRELITEDDFVRARDAAAFRFSSLVAPSASRPLANKQFLAALRVMLTPEQQDRLQANLRDSKDPALFPAQIEDQALPLADFADNIELCMKLYQTNDSAPGEADLTAPSGEPIEVPENLMPPAS